MAGRLSSFLLKQCLLPCAEHVPPPSFAGRARLAFLPVSERQAFGRRGLQRQEGFLDNSSLYSSLICMDILSEQKFLSFHTSGHCCRHAWKPLSFHTELQTDFNFFKLFENLNKCPHKGPSFTNFLKSFVNK